MLYNFIIFGFPVYLIVFEIIFRTVSNLDTSTFIGPTLAATGLSFLLPLIKPKPVILTPKDEKDFINRGLIIKNANDEKLILVIYAAILFGILIWYCSCLSSFLHPNDTLWFFPTHLAVGLINYILGITFTTVKEIV